MQGLKKKLRKYATQCRPFYHAVATTSAQKGPIRLNRQPACLSPALVALGLRPAAPERLVRGPRPALCLQMRPPKTWTEGEAKEACVITPLPVVAPRVHQVLNRGWALTPTDFY